MGLFGLSPLSMDGDDASSRRPLPARQANQRYLVGPVRDPRDEVGFSRNCGYIIVSFPSSSAPQQNAAMAAALNRQIIAGRPCGKSRMLNMSIARGTSRGAVSRASGGGVRAFRAEQNWVDSVAADDHLGPKTACCHNSCAGNEC